MDLLLCLLPVSTHFHNLWYQVGNIGLYKHSQYLLIITTRTVYPRQQLTITANPRWQCNSLGTFMHLHALMHTWPAFMILFASFWLNTSQQGSVHFSCLNTVYDSAVVTVYTQFKMTCPSLPFLSHINVFLCRYDSYGRLTNVTYPTGRVSSYRTDADSSVRIQTEGSNKEDITVTTNLSASGTFYTLMQGECLLLKLTSGACDFLRYFVSMQCQKL